MINVAARKYISLTILSFLLFSIFIYLSQKLVNAQEVIIINNQGTNEGHTPRGFRGSGTGLFVGDNLNPNFPNGDGVQTYLNFDLSQLRGNLVQKATLRSVSAQTNGSPFQDLGNLILENIVYTTFSPDLWDLESQGQICVFADSEGGPFECDLTQNVNGALKNNKNSIQFRLKFENISDSDNQSDLAMFFKTSSNSNEPGLFMIEIISDSIEVQAVPLSKSNSKIIVPAIGIPVIITIIFFSFRKFKGNTNKLDN